MAHLNVYVSREREKWLRDHLEEIARRENRSLSYIVEEALVQFVQQSGKKVPPDKRKDHRSRATQ
jgi:predicted transcriptional regulator